METHRDDEHLGQIMREMVGAKQKAWDDLQREADPRRSSIASGGGEPALAEWDAYGVVVREFPERAIDEPLNMVRISIGGSITEGIAYCTFRGSRAQAKDLLRRALNALSKAP